MQNSSTSDSYLWSARFRDPPLSTTIDSRDVAVCIGIPDGDGDGWCDASEMAFGSSAASGGSTPERAGIEFACSDGIDNDGDTFTDNFDSGCTDTDGDSTANDTDPDDDNDGFPDTAELHMGTKPFVACGFNSWAPESTNDGVVDGSDIGAQSAFFGEASPAGSLAARYDSTADGVVDGSDIGATSSFFGMFNPFCPDTDLDGVHNLVDNCPAVANAGQEDFNGNVTGDACEDSDGDTVIDDIDNCPAWPNSGQALPPWAVAPDDPDCDGWSSDDEGVIGTDPFDGIADNSSENATPADINNDRFTDGTDIGLLAADFGESVPPATVRHDLAPSPPDGVVDGSDIGALAARFGQSY